MKDIKLNLNSKVILLFKNLKKDFPSEESIEGYLEQMGEYFGSERVIGDGYYMSEYKGLGEVKVIAGVITAGLTYQYEYDDLFYTIKDNSIYIDRLKIEEKVR